MLYYDTRLSKDGKNSCNSCHNLATFGVDNLPTSPGDKGINGNRNSPTVLNASLHAFQFWDGRAKDVEEQAGMPILNPVEMNIPSEKFLVDRLKGISLYQDLFKAAFPDKPNPITYENLRISIAAFERTLVTPSRFDQYLAGKTDALSVHEKRGFLAFNTIGCTSCHSGALLGGTMLQKSGVFGNYWDFTGSTYHDEGRAEVTKNEVDKYMFKVPSLRNVEKTYPYFHDGSVKDLSEMVKIMCKMQLKYELSEEETSNIVAFLKSLTGDIPEQFKKAPDELKTM
jgi:cytochrome c peroxidase